MILCIDIGNTHCHFGLVGPEGCAEQLQVRTREIDDPQTGLAAHYTHLSSAADIRGIAFCSVVPAATSRLLALLEGRPWRVPVHHLTHKSRLGVAIHYPRPEEIGPDRLANAAGARALHPGASIVIDMGTAVTFDIVSLENGYEGGIIAPGVELMRRYLHEQTALLPLLDDSLAVSGMIGRSTREAMRIGTVVGFGGMIQALLERVLEELRARGEPMPAIIATGGTAEVLRRGVRLPFEERPDITLRGLERVWQLNEAQT
ncbi:MAG: type III pantothenate kinase [Opitutaceae bacterium]|nr:type III pantothenate kinase [Opitutaceae bacterium]